jgi:hypothetical protein
MPVQQKGRKLQSTPLSATSPWSHPKRVKPEIGTGAVRVVGSSPHKGNAEILKAEKLKSGPRIEAGIAQQGAAYYPTVMTTITLKLPENLLARLERESRARHTTKSSVVRESLTETT